MKKQLIAKARWEFYVSNIAGLIMVLALIVWFCYLSFDKGSIQFTSLYFWLALILIILIPFALITLFSSMKAVVVTEKGLLITYTFQKHTTEVIFADVKKFHTSVAITEKPLQPASLRDSFRLEMIDGRAFEFSRSQFNEYAKLKLMVYKAVGRK